MRLVASRDRWVGLLPQSWWAARWAQNVCQPILVSQMAHFNDGLPRDMVYVTPVGVPINNNRLAYIPDA